MTPRFHVLVPAYGPSPFLPQTLASVLACERADVRLTVVDDGSSDDWVEVAARKAGEGVEYVRLPENLGVAGAFQSCVDRSQGEYTVLLGSDDCVEPGYFDILGDLIDQFGAVELVTCACAVIDAQGNEVLPLVDRMKRLIGRTGSGASLRSGSSLVASLGFGNWLYFPAIAWRTDTIRALGFRRDLATSLDLDLVLRVAFAGGRLAVSTRRGFRYRRHAASVSSGTAVSGDRFDEERDVYRWAATASRTRGWPLASLACRLRPSSRSHSALAKRQAARGSAD